MMARSRASTSSMTKGRYPVQDSGDGDARRRRIRKQEEIEQRSPSSNTIVIEQWICFVLGFACMAFGAWGIYVRPGQHALSRHIAWLGSFYAPLLRLTAIACFGVGLMLMRLGWSHR